MILTVPMRHRPNGCQGFTVIPRDEEARKDRGVEECLTYPEPVQGYREKVFFHTLASDNHDRTFIALVNPDCGDGTPLGVVLRFNKEELPVFTQWKMPRRGFYVTGLEPGTALPLGRGVLRESGDLPMIDGQDEYSITIDFQVVDKMIKEGYDFGIDSNTDTWTASFWHTAGEKTFSLLEAKTAPLAICLAAKEAIEHEPRY